MSYMMDIDVRELHRKNLWSIRIVILIEYRKDSTHSYCLFFKKTS